MVYVCIRRRADVSYPYNSTEGQDVKQKIMDTKNNCEKELISPENVLS